MRPLPYEPLPPAPEFVLGITCIRGLPTPIVDGGRLLSGGRIGTASRFVLLRAGNHHVAFAVDEVLSMRAIPAEALPAVPVITSEGLNSAISAVGTLDRELLAVIESTRLIPEELWSAIQEADA